MAEDSKKGWEDYIPVVGGGVDFFGDLLGGGGEEQKPQYGMMVLPQQRTLLQDMLAKYYLGQGDYGQAGAMREGMNTLYNQAAQAGVPISSGSVQGALASRFGQAAQQSGLQRMLYGLQLSQASPAFAMTNENFGYSPNVMSPYNYGANELGNPDLGNVRFRAQQDQNAAATRGSANRVAGAFGSRRYGY